MGSQNSSVNCAQLPDPAAGTLSQIKANAVGENCMAYCLCYTVMPLDIMAYAILDPKQPPLKNLSNFASQVVKASLVECNFLLLLLVLVCATSMILYPAWRGA